MEESHRSRTVDSYLDAAWLAEGLRVSTGHTRNSIALSASEAVLHRSGDQSSNISSHLLKHVACYKLPIARVQSMFEVMHNDPDNCLLSAEESAADHFTAFVSKTLELIDLDHIKLYQEIMVNFCSLARYLSEDCLPGTERGRGQRC